MTDDLRDSELLELRKEVRQLQGAVKTLRRSKSFRLGRALLAPARLAREAAALARVLIRPTPLDPPRPVELGSKYAQHGAYHWSYLIERPFYREHVEAVTDRVRSESTCLDLGCGDGAAAWGVAQRCRRVVGVDADPDAIRCGREQLASRNEGRVELINTPLEELSQRLPESERFDVVYSLDVIEHLTEPRDLVRCMARWVKPSGTIVVGTPLYVSEEAFSPYHVREFTREQLDDLLLPHFRKVGERLVSSPRPDSKTTCDRFYVFYGEPRRARRLWL